MRTRPRSPRYPGEPEVRRDFSEVIDKALVCHSTGLISEAVDFAVGAKIAVGHALRQEIASARPGRGIGQLHTRIEVTKGDTAHNRAVTIAAGVTAFNVYLRHAERRSADIPSAKASLDGLREHYVAHLSNAHEQWNELRAYDPRVPGDLEINAEALTIMDDDRVLKGALQLSGFLWKFGSLDTEQITDVVTGRISGERIPLFDAYAGRGADSKPMDADGRFSPGRGRISSGPPLGEALTALRHAAAAHPSAPRTAPQRPGRGPFPEPPRSGLR